MEIIIVCIAVGAAMAFGARSLYNTLNGKPPACACGSQACCAAQSCRERAAEPKESHHG